MIALSCTRVGSWLLTTMTPLDRRVLDRSGGRYTVLGPVAAPVLLLTTTGRRTGAPRVTPLLYARDGDSLVVVGSNFGQDHHPAWTGNLLADPRSTVTIGGRDFPVVATALHGAEADRAFGLMVDQTRTCAEYRSRTQREIRVFGLTAV